MKKSINTELRRNVKKNQKKKKLRKMPYSKWECYKCGKVYPNTLLYCPKCNIARKHSYTLKQKEVMREK